jgi:hypothetical protein
MLRGSCAVAISPPDGLKTSEAVSMNDDQV